MAKKKKDEINVEALDFDKVLTETVTSSRLGRAIASLGALLTGREKHDGELVYHLLNAGKKPSPRLPVIASVITESETKKYSPSDAIKWFADNFPKDAQPLLARTQEEYTRPLTQVQYGLQGKRDLDDKFYVDTLTKVAGIPEDQARVLYHGVLKPILEKQREESDLVSLTMKKG